MRRLQLAASRYFAICDSIIGACHAAGFAPSISMASPQISSAANLVSAGFGVAVVPSSMRQVQVEGVSIP
ncbi:LysR substrate-binding domain-containing protein [Paraburkholderia azotifigens]|uniref:LysR substrate-binding domain-containing protein n=1 Tax=Paraburkholderia azotifigens TaxID=2057004 RepID=UPI0038B82D8F